MKELLFVFLIAVSTLLVVSCASSPKTSNVKVPTAEESESAHNHAVWTDWQGMAFGANLPDWVGAVASGSATESELCSLLGKPKGYRLWVINAQGKDFDALKMLTENFDIQAQVQAAISQNVATVANRYQESEGTTDKAKITEQSANVAIMVSGNVSLQGLERVRSYWTKYYTADKKGERLEGPDGEERYNYIVVMGMEKERYESQLDAAMKKIEDNTSEDEYLRKLSSIVIANLKVPEMLQSLTLTN